MASWIPRDRLHVIPPAINASPSVDTREGSEVSEASNHKHKQSKQLLYVGRLSSEKRVDLLLSAWQQVYPSLDGWQLTIAGAGPEESKLQQQAAGMERVDFTGWCEHPALLYQQAELFVLASDYEGFPVALLEALSHGLPCVATASSDALQELNRNGTAVLTVPTGDATALANAILGLAEDISLQTSMSQHAYHISQLYSWQEIGKKWDDILRAMLA
jgi:glycosyltransferase involved in cell wall biosynthesis